MQGRNWDQPSCYHGASWHQSLEQPVPVELSLLCSWMSFSSPNLEFSEESASMECQDSAAWDGTRAWPSLAPSRYSQDLPTTRLLFQGSSIYLKKGKNVLESLRVRRRGHTKYSLFFRGCYPQIPWLFSQDVFLPLLATCA